MNIFYKYIQQVLEKFPQDKTIFKPIRLNNTFEHGLMNSFDENGFILKNDRTGKLILILYSELKDLISWCSTGEDDLNEKTTWLSGFSPEKAIDISKQKLEEK